jgi:hypothetical protein
LINSSLVKVCPLLSNQRYKLVHYYETYLKCQTKKGACIHLSPYLGGEFDSSALSVIKYDLNLQEFPTRIFIPVRIKK